MSYQLYHGACRDILHTLDSNSIDALVTDPPSGIAFMNEAWDRDLGGRDAWIAQRRDEFAEALRVLKPGAYGVVWALPRTSHWTATALEDAGFVVRDIVHHLFGSGFPKSLDISKAIDRQLGKSAEREIVGNEAAQWSGYGTALKPAVEHYILVQKPISEKTIAANVLKWGTGALNIDATRVDARDNLVRPAVARNDNIAYGRGLGKGTQVQPSGRWPAHLLLSHSIFCVDGVCSDDCPIQRLGDQSDASIGTAARYFAQFTHDNDASDPLWRYCAKPSTRERNAGLSALPTKSAHDRVKRVADSAGMQSPRAGAGRTSGAQNHHPTVKPVALMRYLIRLVTPTARADYTPTVLDMYAGSGTTGVAAVYENVNSVLIEGDFDDKGYLDIIRARCDHALGVFKEQIA